MLRPGKAAIVYHAEAGRGRAPALVEPVCRHLRAAGWRVILIEPTQAADHTRSTLAPFLAGRVDYTVVLGGDGTLREVCAGLHDVAAQMPIGFVPAGNANVVARDQGIPLDPEAAIALLTRGELRRLDMGWLRTSAVIENKAASAAHPLERPFLAMVEIGLGAEVVRMVHRLRSGRLKAVYRRWGDPFYATAAAAVLLSSDEIPFQIRLPNTSAPIQAVAAVVANTRCYAKGWAMAPLARMDDGWLDLSARRRPGPAGYIRALRAAALGRSASQATSRCCRGRRFVFHSGPPMAVQVDGDPLPPLNRMEIGIAPGSLRLMVPARPSGAASPTGPRSEAAMTIESTLPRKDVPWENG